MLWRKDSAGALVILRAGANPNAIGDMGVTPLHVAVMQNMPKAVEALLSAGANPNIRSEFGKTAKEEAVALGGEIAKIFKGCA
ncbi:Ankyrin repeat protein [compost metagenome]